MARPKTATLTREKVLEGAIAIIGDRGLEDFSMAKLGASLGVRAPTLYYYFADKDALLAAVARAVATPEPPAAFPPDVHWTDYLIANAAALRRTIVAHPHCAPLLVRFMPHDSSFGETEQVCRFLTGCGVPARLHLRILDGLTALTIGAGFLRENSADYTEYGVGPKPDPDTFPAMHEALAAIGDLTPDQLFETYLRTYLDSIIREMAAGTAQGPGRPDSTGPRGKRGM